MPLVTYQNILKIILSYTAVTMTSSMISSSNASKKTLLQQCIPFVKFRNLTSKGFNLIDSKIITYQHGELISKWIDKLEITDNIKNSYNFRLLFRGSRDGLSGDEFLKVCDNQSRTVTIVKVKDSSEILGGYNPIEWKSESIQGVTNDSFIFSFKSKNSIEDHILSRVIDRKCAISNDYFCGPSFDSDLTIWQFNFISDSDYEAYNYTSYCRKTSYEKPIREIEGFFSVEECEVFLVEPDPLAISLTLFFYSLLIYRVK